MWDAEKEKRDALPPKQNDDGLRPCPRCPDGNVWTANGPTGAVCPTCKGYAFVNMDGSPCAASIAQLEAAQQTRKE